MGLPVGSDVGAAESISIYQTPLASYAYCHVYPEPHLLLFRYAEPDKGSTHDTFRICRKTIHAFVSEGYVRNRTILTLQGSLLRGTLTLVVTIILCRS